MIRQRTTLIFILDALIFFGALALTLLIRYGYNLFEWSFFKHLPIFIILFILWVGVVYLTDLYQLRVFKRKITLLGNLFLALSISLLVSVILFYLFGDFFQITPKINLLLFSIIFLVFDYLGRLSLNKIFFIKQRIPILFLGESPTTLYLINDLKSNPQLGYDVVSLIKENEISLENLKPLFYKKAKIETIVVSSSFKNKEEFVGWIYSLPNHIKIIDFMDFYEMIYQKEPLELLNDTWFIENLSHHSSSDTFKRIFDLFLSFISLIIFLPLILICA